MPAAIVVSPSSVMLPALDREAPLSATVLDQQGDRVPNVVVSWSSADTTLVTVTESGRVRAVRPGETTISARVERLSASATVAVVTDERPVFAGGGTIVSPDGTVSLSFPTGAVSDRVIVLMEPAAGVLASPRMVAGTAVELTPDGSRFSAPVVLSIRYEVSAVPDGADEGELRIHRLSTGEWVELPSGSVDVSNRSASAPIQGFSVYSVLVTPDGVAVDVVTMTPSTKTIGIDESLQLHAELRDAEGQVLERRAIQWTSSAPQVAAVDSSGLVTGISLGDAVIRAESGGVEAVATVTVGPAVHTVLVTPEKKIVVKETLQLQAELRDVEGRVLADRTIVWTSDTPAVATVDDNGLVTGVSAGDAVIKAESGRAEGALALTVEPPVHVVIVAPSAETITVGETLQLQVELRDVEGQSLEGRAIDWTSTAPAIATVGASGLVRGVSPGVAVIKAESGGVEGSSTITVEPPPPTAGELTGFWAGTTSTGLDVTFEVTEAGVVRDFGFEVPIRLSALCFSLHVGFWAPGQTHSISGGAFVGEVDSQRLQFTTQVQAAFESADHAVGTYEGATGQIGGYQCQFVSLSGTRSFPAGSWEAWKQAPMASVEIEPSTVSLHPCHNFSRPESCDTDEAATLTATARDESGNALRVPFVWDVTDTTVTTLQASSDPPPVSSSSSADIAAVLPGNSTVTVAAAGGSGSAEVAVTLWPDVLKWSQISSNNFHACGIATTGLTYCWGSGASGRLGSGTSEDQGAPFLVAGGIAFASVETGINQTCGVATTGDAYCWGYGADGLLGNGATDNELLPALVAGGLSFVSVHTYFLTSCGLTVSGEAYCWGRGHLGDGDLHTSLVPVQVSGGHTFTQLTMGSDHVCGVTRDGELYCWGATHLGQAGDGTGASQLFVPTKVASDEVWAQVSAGDVHTCGVTLAGAAYCWGSGLQGRLGNGALENQGAPVRVSGSAVFQSVDAGRGHTCGLTTSNEVLCWGRGETGRLGNGDVSNSSVPVKVVGGLSFTSLSAGHGTCGISTDGIAYCWGQDISQEVHFPIPVPPPAG